MTRRNRNKAIAVAVTVAVHAIVVILIIGAIITPTGDPFTLSLVAVPIYLLWEVSILIVKHTEQ